MPSFSSCNCDSPDVTVLLSRMAMAQSGRGRLEYDYGGDGSGIIFLLALLVGIVAYICWVALKRVLAFFRDDEIRRHNLLRGAFLGVLAIVAIFAAKPFFQAKMSQNEFRRLLEQESQQKEFQTAAERASDERVSALCQARLEDARIWVSRAHSLAPQTGGHHTKIDQHSLDISFDEAGSAAQTALAQAAHFCQGDAGAANSVDKLQVKLDSVK